MMRKFSLHFIFSIFFCSILLSCEENIPRDRPIFNFDIDLEGESPGGDEEQSDSPEAEASRPSNAIIIQSNHCACSAGKSISIGDCDAFCDERSSSSNSNRILFFDVNLTTAISETNLKDVAGFCNTQEGEEAVASCTIEVKDESGSTEFLTFTPTPGRSSFEVDVGALAENQTFRLSIVESSSQARSSTIQLRLISSSRNDPIGGPLALMPVNQYSCLFRNSSADGNGQIIIDDVNRFHFYFIPDTRPEPLKASTLGSINCYDIEAFGTTPINSPLLEETTGAFTVWNKSDPRFFDLSGTNTGTRAINDIISRNMELQGHGLSSALNLFFPLEWPSGINDGEANPSDEERVSSLDLIKTSLGFYMTPFLDDQTFKAFCPKQEHYYSKSPLFKAMREVVGVDTEGLYAAKQDNACDFILIRETLLKDVWFYIEGGQHIAPTSETISGKKVQFYWPVDKASPFIKKSHQRVYTLKASSEITCDSITPPTSVGTGDSGVSSNFPPHDKRIGCIPVLAN